VINGGDIVGTFPKGFVLQIVVEPTYLIKVAKFVITKLGVQPIGSKEAVHVFVADKSEGNRLFSIMRKRFDCRFVSADTSPEEINQVSSDWSMSKFQ
jgi:hypothetical protein